MDRTSTAVWNGAGKTGSGNLTSQSNVLNKTPYSFNSRFAEKTGTNPEELIAAAHAGCYSMKLSFVLEEAGFPPDKIETTSTVTLTKEGIITSSHLDVKAEIPGISEEIFQKCAADAKTNCPVSKALNATITMKAKLL